RSRNAAWPGNRLMPIGPGCTITLPAGSEKDKIATQPAAGEPIGPGCEATAFSRRVCPGPTPSVGDWIGAGVLVVPWARARSAVTFPIRTATNNFARVPERDLARRLVIMVPPSFDRLTQSATSRAETAHTGGGNRLRYPKLPEAYGRPPGIPTITGIG